MARKKNQLSRSERKRQLRERQQRDAKLQAVLKQRKIATGQEATDAFLKLLREGKAYQHPLTAYFGNFGYLYKELNHGAKYSLDNIIRALQRNNVGQIAQDWALANAIAQLATFHKSFVRKPQIWSTREKTPRKIFGSLARHLFAKYSLPLCFDDVFYDGWDNNARLWYIDIAQGSNPRNSKYAQFRLTKRTTHHLMNPPTGLDLRKARTWAMVRALGGSPFFAAKAADSALRWHIDQHKGRCEALVRWSLLHPAIQLADFHAIVSYLIGVWQDNPNYTLKGRDPQRIVEEAVRWRKLVLNAENNQQYSWAAQPFDNSTIVTGKGNKVKFDVKELTNSKRLVQEGNRMDHCVADYASKCMAGKTAILSFIEGVHEHNTKPLPVLTVEVNLRNKTVIQARRKANMDPKDRQLKAVRIWAERNGFELSKWFND